MQDSSTRPDQANAVKKDVVVFKFVVVVQDDHGLPPRGGVLPARAGECCISSSTTTGSTTTGNMTTASGSDIAGCGLVVAVSGKMAAHY